MMKTLSINEGDPIRLTGTALPKGKMVKIQAQSTDFLQVSDAKAVTGPPLITDPKLCATLLRASNFCHFLVRGWCSWFSTHHTRGIAVKSKHDLDAVHSVFINGLKACYSPAGSDKFHELSKQCS